MALVINTNINALRARGNLRESQQALSTAMTRLSTGKRINSAKDDAAGLAISTRFTTQIRGLRQAKRNASDGISLAQTAGSALEQVTENLQRIRTLAVQSLNATNSASDRKALNQEVQQRLDEITRVATQTTFNGLKILDGSFGRATFQVGANVGDTITVNLDQGVRARQMGELMQAKATGSTIGSWPVTLSGDVTFQVGDGNAISLFKGQSFDSIYAVAEGINDLGVEGLLAKVGTDSDGNKVLKLRAVGGDLKISGAASDIGLSAGTIQAQADGKSLAVSNVLTVESSNKMIQRVDKALAYVSSIRSQLGAVQNRFNSTISNLQTVATSLAASRSRIMDADYAKVTAKLAKAKILRQAGISVLSQANAAPQAVLQLLR